MLVLVVEVTILLIILLIPPLSLLTFLYLGAVIGYEVKRMPGLAIGGLIGAAFTMFLLRPVVH